MSFEYFQAESHVSTYNRFRPSPPNSLVEEITSFVSERISELDVAVDVGCGSGQSTEGLSKHFKKVIGLDPSASIIAEAKKKNAFPNIVYSQSSAEKLELLADDSASLMTVVQAIHWFDLDKFYAEVKRILRKDGVLAIIGYQLPVPLLGNNDELAGIVKKYYSEVLGDYVLPESKRVYLDQYHAEEFNNIPFMTNGTMIRREDFTSEAEATLDDVTGYMASWSTFQNYCRQKGEEAGQELLQMFEKEFKETLKSNVSSGEPLLAMKVQFKYFLLLGRKA